MRSVVLTVILAITSSIACAADSPILRLAAANRYLKVVPISTMLDDMGREMAKQMPSEKRAKFLSQFKAGIRVEMLERVTRDAMVKVFSADELNALADFYGSPHGASAMKKFGAYMALVMPAIQQEVMQAMTKLEESKKTN
jgi:hypothetical protein